MRGQYSPNQEFRPETQNAQTRRDNVNAPMGNRAGQSSGKNEQNEGQTGEQDYPAEEESQKIEESDDNLQSGDSSSLQDNEKYPEPEKI